MKNGVAAMDGGGDLVHWEAPKTAVVVVIVIYFHHLFLRTP